MTTVEFSTEFVLSAVNKELAEANKSSAELERLSKIGYIHSQTGLDVAKKVKTHLMRAYETLSMANGPEITVMRMQILETIVRQELIIGGIELNL